MTEDELFVRILADPEVRPRYRPRVGEEYVGAAWFEANGGVVCVTFVSEPIPGTGEGRDREVITRLLIEHHGERNVSDALGYTTPKYHGLEYTYVIIDELTHRRGYVKSLEKP